MVLSNTESAMKRLSLLPSIALIVFLSCSKLDPDPIDPTLIEGYWRVESIRYEGILPDGTKVSDEPVHCDVFWTGDVVEFRGGLMFQGEKGSSFYSLFSGYPGSIQYAIIGHQLFIPEQVFPDYAQDAGGGWTVTIATSVGEWTLPSSLSGDTWVIRHEQRSWYKEEYQSIFSCDFEFVLKRVQ